MPEFLILSDRKLQLMRAGLGAVTNFNPFPISFKTANLQTHQSNQEANCDYDNDYNDKGRGIAQCDRP
jgi:hypothetical protein